MTLCISSVIFPFPSHFSLLFSCLPPFYSILLYSFPVLPLSLIAYMGIYSEYLLSPPLPSLLPLNDVQFSPFLHSFPLFIPFMSNGQSSIDIDRDEQTDDHP